MVLIFYLVLLLFSVISFKLILLFSRKFILFDAPDGVLKLHKVPIPNLGGLALFLAFSLTFFYGIEVSWQSMCWFSGLFILFLFGALDDRRRLTPLQKFSAQLLATMLLVQQAHVPFNFFPVWLTYSLSMLIMLTIINAFNLVDVMDGLAGTISLGICLSLTVICWRLGLPYTVLGIGFIISLIPFLFYNFPAAQIYLGDAGSQFIGGLLCFVALKITDTVPWHNPYEPLFFLGFLFFIPLAELFSLIIIRSYKGIPCYLGSRDHFCHYLQRNGWTDIRILKLVASFAALFSVTTIGFCLMDAYRVVIFTCMCGISLAWIYFFSRQYLKNL